MHTEEGLAGIKHDYTVLGFVCCSSDCKITTALFPVVFSDSRLKLYFQPTSESPKTVSLIKLY